MQTRHYGSRQPLKVTGKAQKLQPGRVLVQTTQVHQVARPGLSGEHGKRWVLRQTLLSPTEENSKPLANGARKD